MNKAAITALLSMAAALSLFALNVSAYPVPDKESATLVLEETQILTDREPATEITIKTYKMPDGTRFREYGVEGKVFRYDIDEDGVAPYEYRILDNDGDGSFETRETLVGKAGDNGERYFIDLGSEPGKEYRYWYEDNPSFKEREVSDHRTVARIMEGFSIYIPSWVLLKFD